MATVVDGVAATTGADVVEVVVVCTDTGTSPTSMTFKNVVVVARFAVVVTLASVVVVAAVALSDESSVLLETAPPMRTAPMSRTIPTRMTWTTRPPLPSSTTGLVLSVIDVF